MTLREKSNQKKKEEEEEERGKEEGRRDSESMADDLKGLQTFEEYKKKSKSKKFVEGIHENG